MDLFSDILQQANKTHQKKNENVRKQSFNREKRQEWEEKRRLGQIDQQLERDALDKIVPTSKLRKAVGNSGIGGFSDNSAAKAQVSQKKALSFEDLMRKAEKNLHAKEITDINATKISQKKIKNSSLGKILPSEENNSASKRRVIKSRKRKGQQKLELVKLNTKKRDLRTIDEIQRDLKKSTNNPAISRPKISANSNEHKSKSAPKSFVNQTKPVSKSASNQKQKSHSEESIDDPEYIESNISSIIQCLFNKSGRSRRIYDDDDLDDMEASTADIEREEKRSSHIGRMEDIREQKLQESMTKKKSTKGRP